MTDPRIKTLEQIAEDQKKDAENFQGQPFTGKTVGTYFGYQGAAITALAEILKSVIEESNNKK